MTQQRRQSVSCSVVPSGNKLQPSVAKGWRCSLALLAPQTPRRKIIDIEGRTIWRQFGSGFGIAIFTLNSPSLPAAKLHLKRDAYTKIAFPYFIEELSRPGQTSRQLDE